MLSAIVLSAGGGIESAVKSLRKGALDFLQSPITIEILKSRMHLYLENTTMKARLENLALEFENQAIGYVFPVSII